MVGETHRDSANLEPGRGDEKAEVFAVTGLRIASKAAQMPNS
jgi:hypothetical protein